MKPSENLWNFAPHPTCSSWVASGGLDIGEEESGEGIPATRGVGLKYDTNGNLTNFGVKSYTFDWRNRVATSSTGVASTTYAYDHTFERVKKTAGSVTTLYANDYFNKAGATTTRQVYAHGELIATSEGNGVATTTSYMHADHLGSTNAVTDESGDVVQVLDYYPYGDERIDVESGADEKRKFAGMYRDDESGLDYATARYYDNTRGQFLSQDPSFLDIGRAGFEQNYGRTLQMHLANPQALNSYSWALNNPIIYKDPEGEIVPLLVLGALAFYGGYSAGTDLYEGYTSGDNGQFAVGVVGASISLFPGGSAAKGALAAGDDVVRAAIKVGEAGGVGAGKKFSQSIKDLARAQAEGKCVFCGRQTTSQSGSLQSNIDHAVPRSLGGNNTINNAQNTCRTCNLSKGAQSSIEYVQRQLVNTLKTYIKTLEKAKKSNK